MSFLRSATFSVTYSLGQIILGLLLHPFQTMQSLVRDKYWLWMAFFPIMVLAGGFLIWGATWLIVYWFFSPTPDFLLRVMSFILRLIKWWFLYFCLVWQVLLLLLLVKFWLFFHHRNKKI